MGRLLSWIGAALAVLAVWLAIRYRGYLHFIWRLAGARRQAQRFYAECPGLTKNVPYGAQTGRTLDVYRPSAGDRHPVLVYVYGGSWNSGNKELYAPAAQRLLPEGFVLVVPDYTTFPNARYPTPSEEIAAALAWTFDEIDRFGGDPRQVVLVAQSAGAQVAGLCLTDPRYLAAHGHQPAELKGFIGISGVYDMETQLAFERKLRRSENYVASVIGGRQNAGAASPLTFAGPHGPPTLLIHGDADGTVPLEMSYKFHQRVLDTGGKSELTVYAGGGHSGLLFDALAHNPSRLFSEIVAFARQCVATTQPLPVLPADQDRPAPAIGA